MLPDKPFPYWVQQWVVLCRRRLLLLLLLLGSAVLLLRSRLFLFPLPLFLLSLLRFFLLQPTEMSSLTFQQGSINRHHTFDRWPTRNTALPTPIIPAIPAITMIFTASEKERT